MLFTPTSRQEKFQEMVNERGRRLRTVPFEELRRLVNDQTEHLTVESREATITFIVQPQADGAVRVVVQGFMSTWPFRGIKRVALDGFYKSPDETLAPMSREEFREFD